MYDFAFCVVEWHNRFLVGVQDGVKVRTMDGVAELMAACRAADTDKVTERKVHVLLTYYGFKVIFTC